VPGRSGVQGRGNQPRGIASWSRGRTRQSRTGRQGDAPTPGRQHAAPYGQKPTGRGAAAGWLSPPPQASGALSNAPLVTASARVGRAVVLAPGMLIAVRTGHRGRTGTPRIVRGGPSSVKGTRGSFLTAPQKGSSGPTLERRSLCRPSGPDGKGQAGGQAR
jgi:hypothetical protein